MTDSQDNQQKNTAQDTQNTQQNVAQGGGTQSHDDQLSESFQGQNQTRSERPANVNNSGYGSHAAGAQNTGKEGNLGGRNPGQETISGDRDKTQSRGEGITDPMTSRDPALHKKSDAQ